MKALVTGGAGFIGSHLTERLLKEGHEVIVIDNASSGRNDVLDHLNGREGFGFIRADLLDDAIDDFFKGVDEVYHFAANPDVKAGNSDTHVHFNQNVVVTYRVLEACRKAGVKKFVFASSSTVYGDATTIPTPEDSRLEPISLYGASKLACESLISSYAHSFGIASYVFRLANVIGGRSGHGVIFDFIRKLNANPGELEILGDGLQSKSYIHVEDCIDAMFAVVKRSLQGFQVYNIGSEDRTDVRTIARAVSSEMGLQPKFKFTGGERGWKGDVPKMMLDITSIKRFGWKPKYTSEEAVSRTVREALDACK